MRAGLSTHVLDLAHGRPAAGMTIELWFAGALVTQVVTNADGRTDGPLVDTETLAPGEYELVFHVGAYFAAAGGADAVARADSAASSDSPDPPGAVGFLDRVPVRFIVRNPGGRYHVPLLCSPWAYSTYRGS